MTTVLQYLVIAAVVAAVLFGIALFVFGRGEQLSPLPARTSPVDLPERDISGSDVRGVRFAMAARGYRMSDVDWALERLADELDRTKARLAEVDPETDLDADPFGIDPDQQDLFADDEPIDPADRYPAPADDQPVRPDDEAVASQEYVAPAEYATGSEYSTASDYRTSADYSTAAEPAVEESIVEQRTASEPTDADPPAEDQRDSTRHGSAEQ